MKEYNMLPIAHRGLMFVLSSPSGAGKTTVTKKLLAKDHNLDVSISVTTRIPRPGEVDGCDYHFLTTCEFDNYIAQGQFLEHAKVFDNFYGTLKQPVINAIERGRDMIFDVDWQGAQQLTQNWRADLVKIFILPPSHAELEKRLSKRNQDSSEIVSKRMSKAVDEISHWDEYDYIVINHNISTCVDEVYAILMAERCKSVRQQGMAQFVETLIPMKI